MVTIYCSYRVRDNFVTILLQEKTRLNEGSKAPSVMSPCLPTRDLSPAHLKFFSILNTRSFPLTVSQSDSCRELKFAFHLNCLNLLISLAPDNFYMLHRKPEASSLYFFSFFLFAFLSSSCLPLFLCSFALYQFLLVFNLLFKMFNNIYINILKTYKNI